MPSDVVSRRTARSASYSAKLHSWMFHQMYWFGPGLTPCSLLVDAEDLVVRPPEERRHLLVEDLATWW